MQSLRTRRPSQAAPPGKQAGKAKVNSRDVRKSTRVDDKIRKRMSTRYAISSPTDATVPAVPSLPIGVRQEQFATQDNVLKDRTQQKEDAKLAETKMLDADNFDPDAFLKAKLANSTEEELKFLRSSLQSSKDEVAVDLQRNVFKNYAEFVLVSKEVSTLENEMLEFKESLAEWKGMPSLLHIDESASVAERRRNVRSSIADLRVLYANQMQTLHAQIEGSTKFVPTTPGRHVVTEVDGILALNSATYKVDHSVRFVLLDDAVLVARRRRRRNNNENDKLVAERCWSLNEMLVLDTKDTATMTNVFKIRHGKETHVYRTETAADKKNLLTQFRLIAEELAAKKRKEREGEHIRRKSLWNGGDRAPQSYGAEPMPPVPDWMADLVAKSDLNGNAKEKAERDARWVGDFTDDLTVAIALREWDRAVQLVEEGEAKLLTTPLIGPKLSSLKASLISALLHSLSMPTNRKSSVVHLISLLVRMKAGAAARSTFLAARTEVMRQRIRMIRFEGHIGMYIGDLSIVMFTGIKHTADWFLASFKENEVASCFIEWARKQIESYAQMFRTQVYSSDVDPRAVEEAMQITYNQSRKLLEEYGLDFRFLLEDLLAGKSKDSPKPPQYRPHAQKHPDPIRTPASTPIRSRSPAIMVATPIPSRARSPSGAVPPVPPLPNLSSIIPVPSVRSPVPRMASAASTRSAISTSSTADLRQPRSIRGSPAPPPRSRDRPGSAAGRPQPLVIPRREGMF